MEQDQPEKKQPAGKKMTSVIFTIFCFLINFLIPGLGILLPVVVCIAEIVYAKRKNIAEHKAKAITVCLCIILAVFVVSVLFTNVFLYVLTNKNN